MDIKVKSFFQMNKVGLKKNTHFQNGTPKIRQKERETEKGQKEKHKKAEKRERELSHCMLKKAKNEYQKWINKSNHFQSEKN